MSNDSDLVFGVLVGSLRKESLNRKLAAALKDHVPDGVRLEDLPSIGDLPLYDQDVQDAGIPAAATALSERIAATDAVVIVTPEYNYSVPGVLKNALDWMSRTKPQPFAGKPVAIMSASPGPYGGVRAQHHLRQVLVALNAVTLARPEVIVRAAGEAFDEAGRLKDERTHEFLDKAMDALADYARRFR